MVTPTIARSCAGPAPALLMTASDGRAGQRGVVLLAVARGVAIQAAQEEGAPGILAGHDVGAWVAFSLADFITAGC